MLEFIRPRDRSGSCPTAFSKFKYSRFNNAYRTHGHAFDPKLRMFASLLVSILFDYEMKSGTIGPVDSYEIFNRIVAISVRAGLN